MTQAQRDETAGLIRERRKKLGINQETLAERLHVSVTTVSLYERGRRDFDATRTAQFEAALGIVDARLLIAAGHKKEPPPMRDGRPALIYELPFLTPDQEAEVLRFIDWLRYRYHSEGR